MIISRNLNDKIFTFFHVLFHTPYRSAMCCGLNCDKKWQGVSVFVNAYKPSGSGRCTVRILWHGSLWNICIHPCYTLKMTISFSFSLYSNIYIALLPPWHSTLYWKRERQRKRKRKERKNKKGYWRKNIWALPIFRMSLISSHLFSLWWFLWDIVTVVPISHHLKVINHVKFPLIDESPVAMATWNCVTQMMSQSTFEVMEQEWGLTAMQSYLSAHKLYWLYLERNWFGAKPSKGCWEGQTSSHFHLCMLLILQMWGLLFDWDNLICLFTSSTWLIPRSGYRILQLSCNDTALKG